MGRSTKQTARSNRDRKTDFPLTGYKAIIAVLGPAIAVVVFVFTNFAKTEDLKSLEKESKEYARELNKGTKEDIKELKVQQKETAKEMRDYFIQQQILLEKAIDKDK